MWTIEPHGQVMFLIDSVWRNAQGTPLRRDGRPPVSRALDLAAGLADLCGGGLPLDAESIAAALVRFECSTLLLPC